MMLEGKLGEAGEKNEKKLKGRYDRSSGKEVLIAWGFKGRKETQFAEASFQAKGAVRRRKITLVK